MTLVLALGVVLAGCGGGGATSDPTGVVNELVKILEAKQWDKVADLACAEKKEEISKQFNFAESFGGAIPGADAQKVSDALTFKFENVQVKEESREGNTATVSIKGKMAMTMDPTKLKDLVTEALKASGQDATDEMVDLALGAMGTEFNFTEDMDETLTVVNEGGKWLLCE
jgi:hypothetical protein